MSWNHLTSISQIDKIDIDSENSVIILFKHSTRCSISEIAKTRIEKIPFNLPPNSELYFLDLIRYREVSDEIAQRYHVYHESPQVLLIKNKECFFDCSHLDISWPLLLNQIEKEMVVLQP